MLLKMMTLPASWRAVLQPLRPVFSRGRTFALFVMLATGLAARTYRRTVVGMLAGAGMTAVVSFHSACRFFSTHRWDTDRLGLTVARIITELLIPSGAAIAVAIDDTLFKRWGPKVHHAFWTHDGAAQGPSGIGRGNRWVVAGIVVTVPFTCRPVCLPVLFRLWAGKGTASHVKLAGQMIELLAEALPDRKIHIVGDAAYHGMPLLIPGTTITTRLSANATLYAPTPPRTGKRGAPRKKGAKLGKPADVANTARWHEVTVTRYGRTESVAVAEVDCLWYGTFKDTPGRLVAVRDPGSATMLAIFTTDTDAPAAEIVARYADRWTIETANATGKQILGVGQARNRLPRAVARTVPFGFLVQSLITVWYATAGYHPDDLDGRHTVEPWYTSKTEVAFEDILAKFRRTIIAAKFMAPRPDQPEPAIIHEYQLACTAAAA
jgi:hypothetical protein